jgi:hypothetical protein
LGWIELFVQRWKLKKERRRIRRGGGASAYIVAGEARNVAKFVSTVELSVIGPSTSHGMSTGSTGEPGGTSYDGTPPTHEGIDHSRCWF